MIMMLYDIFNRNTTFTFYLNHFSHIKYIKPIEGGALLKLEK